MKCNWCKGRGIIYLRRDGSRTCPNCKGSGVGKDGGPRGGEPESLGWWGINTRGGRNEVICGCRN